MSHGKRKSEKKNEEIIASDSNYYQTYYHCKLTLCDAY